MAVHVHNPRAGEEVWDCMRGAADIEISGTSWPDNLAEKANSRFSERL